MIKTIQIKVGKCFQKAFGRTPQRQRLQDIFDEAVELRYATDYSNLKEKTGDLLASTIQLCNESEWDMEDVVKNTLQKIKSREKQYQSLGRKTRVAILGGAFDPPTIGHVKLAQFVLNTSKTFDEVWLTPCFSHMYNKEMVSFEHRLNMCKLMADPDGRIKAFSYEGEKKLKDGTYNFVKTLLGEQFSKDEFDFSLIIGQDNANTFNKWVKYEELEKMIRFVVVPREGEKVDPKSNWYLNPPHIYLYGNTGIPNISSTHIRSLVNRCSFLETLGKVDHEEIKNEIIEGTSQEVFDYINKNKLYINK